MSDPLAVYTQFGIGATNKGLNLKIGQTYDTGSETTMGMNVLEIKGFAGEVAGWDSNDVRDDSIDSFRFRDFNVDLTNGRGRQLDVSYNIDTETADASYSFLQATPKIGAFQFYPLAGVGATIENNAEHGYQFSGTFAVVGMYSKIEVTDKIWLNYNPMWLTTMSGSDEYKDSYYANENDIMTHEFTVSYKLNQRSNIRYFANWNEHNSFEEGDHRIEYNFQF